MKKLIVLLLMLPLLGRAQAHIGLTDSQIRAEHSSITFTQGSTEEGVPFIISDLELGEFYYYFDINGYCDFVIQVPYTMKSVNGITELYNKKYVIINDREWKAYLDDGSIIYVLLQYNVNLKSWIFAYNN